MEKQIAPLVALGLTAALYACAPQTVTRAQCSTDSNCKNGSRCDRNLRLCIAETDAGGVASDVDAGPHGIAVQWLAPDGGGFVGGTVELHASANAVSGVKTLTLNVDQQLLRALEGGDAEAAWDSSTVSDGPHSLSAVGIANDTSAQTSTLDIQVDNTPPALSWAAPATDAGFLGGTIHLEVVATDQGSGVRQVDFSIDDGGVLGSATQAPYALDASFVGSAPGMHTVVATATDAVGNAASATRPIELDAPPAIAVSSPVNGASVPRGSTVTLSAHASDDVSVASVQFLLDGQDAGVVATGASGIYSVTVAGSTLSMGAHTLTAAATDDVGLAATATSRFNVTDDPPTISISSPAPGTDVHGDLQLVAQASDDVRVSSVQFLLDGQDAGVTVSGDGGEYATTLAGLSLSTGAHTLQAVATDDVGLTGSANSTFNEVDDPPQITIDSPANSASIQGDAVTITGHASDDVGLSGVALSIGGVQGSSYSGSGASSFRYVLNACLYPPGPLQVSATAADSRGQQGSASITLTNASQPPLLQALAGEREIDLVAAGQCGSPTGVTLYRSSTSAVQRTAGVAMDGGSYVDTTIPVGQTEYYAAAADYAGGGEGPLSKVANASPRNTCFANNWCVDNPPLGNYQLNATWERSPSDVFAVGPSSVVIHYDGTSWKREVLPRQGENLIAVVGDAGSTTLVASAKYIYKRDASGAWQEVWRVAGGDLSTLWWVGYSCAQQCTNYCCPGSLASPSFFAGGYSQVYTSLGGTTWSTPNQGWVITSNVGSIRSLAGVSSMDFYALTASAYVHFTAGGFPMAYSNTVTSLAGGKSMAFWGGALWALVDEYVPSPQHYNTNLYRDWTFIRTIGSSYALTGAQPASLCSDGVDMFDNTVNKYYLDGGSYGYARMVFAAGMGCAAGDVRAMRWNGQVLRVEPDGGQVSDAPGLYDSSLNGAFAGSQLTVVGNAGGLAHHDARGWVTQQVQGTRYDSVTALDATRTIAVGFNAAGAGSPVSIVFDGVDWINDTTPPPSGLNATSLGLLATAGTDVFMLYSGNGNFTQRRPSGWTLGSSAGLSMGAAMAGTSPNDVWAIDSAANVQHYDGSQWSARLPVSGTTSTNGIWAAAPNDAYLATGSNIQHWNGAIWSVVSGFPSQTYYSVTGTGGADVWALGAFSVQQWNGAKGQAYPLPSMSGYTFRKIWEQPAQGVYISADELILHRGP